MQYFFLSLWTHFVLVPTLPNHHYPPQTNSTQAHVPDYAWDMSNNEREEPISMASGLIDFSHTKEKQNLMAHTKEGANKIAKVIASEDAMEYHDLNLSLP